MADGDERLKRYTYTVSEAAPLIGVSERTLYRLLAGKRGRVEIAPGIVALRVSNRWVIPSWQVHRALGETTDDAETANNKPEPPPEPEPPPQSSGRLRARIERPRTIMRVTIYREPH